MIYEDRRRAWGALMPFFRTWGLYEMQAIWESEQSSIYSKFLVSLPGDRWHQEIQFIFFPHHCLSVNNRKT